MDQMVTRMASLAIVSCLLLFSAAVLADDACPRWEYGGMYEVVPRQTVCSSALNTRFNRSDAYMTVTLRQTDEAWGSDPRKDTVISEIKDAINAGLDLIATRSSTKGSIASATTTLQPLCSGTRHPTRARALTASRGR